MLKYLFVAFFFLAGGCGTDTVRTRYVPIDPIDPGAPSPPRGGDEKPSYQETVALLNTYCQKCHSSAAFMGSEKGLLASAAKQRVWNKSMPPDQSSLPDVERKKILAFFL